MTTDDIILIAVKAIQELGVTESQQNYIDGVITMALLMQENEHGLQMLASDLDVNALIADERNKARSELDAMTQERDELRKKLTERSDAASHLAACVTGRDVAMSKLWQLIDEHASSGASAVIRRLFREWEQQNQHSTPAPSLGRIHYATRQPGHLEP